MASLFYGNKGTWPASFGKQRNLASFFGGTWPVSDWEQWNIFKVFYFHGMKEHRTLWKTL